VAAIDDRTRTIALSLTRSVGWKLTHRLLERSARSKRSLPPVSRNCARFTGLGSRLQLTFALSIFAPCRRLERFAAQGIITPLSGCDLSSRLLEIDDKPLMLFWKGMLLPADQQAVAIVGTREASSESLAAAQQYAAAFAERGWTVIRSGAWIDSAAHQAHSRQADARLRCLAAV